MSRGINKVILVGNLGKDPDVRYTAGGAAVSNITLATTSSWRDKESGEQQDKTEWHRIVFFGRLAEIVAEYLRKGAQVYIEGRLQTRKWQDKEGNDRYTTEIVPTIAPPRVGYQRPRRVRRRRRTEAGDSPAPTAPPRCPRSHHRKRWQPVAPLLSSSR